MEVKLIMPQLKAYLTYWARQLNRTWQISIVLALLLVSFLVVILIPELNRLDQLTQRLHQLSAVAQSERSNAQQRLNDASGGHQSNFEDGFPGASSIPDVIAKLIDLAHAKGLEPKEATYQFGKNQAGDLLAYQIRMPINGAYTNVVGFVLDLLVKTPNLALENISLKRKTIGDGVVDATLAMTLYLKKDGH
jgi:type II secretory pathway pseudopilin PulG